jgi:hypothetical protein
MAALTRRRLEKGQQTFTLEPTEVFTQHRCGCGKCAAVSFTTFAAMTVHDRRGKFVGFINNLSAQT